MSVNDFAHVGVFVIAMIGFALETGLFGVLIVPDDWETYSTYLVDCRNNRIRIDCNVYVEVVTE